MSNNILLPAITAPDSAHLTQRAQSALKMVESMVIDSSETYELAGDELKAIKAKSKQLEEQRTGITGPINKALRAVNDLFRGPIDYLDRAERVIKGKMIDYSEEQARIVAEARRKAEAEAAAERRRLEEEARKREAEAAAEAKRLADEAAAAQAAGNAAAAAAAQAQAEQVQQAAASEAAALQMTAAVVTAPVAPIDTPKAAGVSKVKITYKADVFDKMAFIAFIAQRPDLAMLLDVNMTKLNGMARAQGAAMAYPGVRAVEEKSIAARAA